MFIQHMPTTLRWRDRSTLLDVHRDYVNLLSDILATRIAFARGESVWSDSELYDVVEQAGEDTLVRVITAPETSWRLIWQPMRDAGEHLNFITHGLQRELWKSGRGGRLRPGWSVLGNFEISGDGRIRSHDLGSAMMPVDIGSPFRANVDLGNGVDANRPLTAPLFGTNRHIIADRIVKAEEIIRRVSPLVADFVSIYTKVLVVQVIPSEEVFHPAPQGSTSEDQP